MYPCITSNFPEPTRFKTVVNHFWWWLFFISYELGLVYYSGSFGNLYRYFFYYGINILLFYTQYRIMDKTMHLSANRFVRLLGWMTLEVTAYLVIKLYLDYVFTDYSRSGESLPSVLKKLAALDLYRCIFFIALAFLYWTASNISRFERETTAAKIRQLMTARNSLELEASLARSQNALLRQQINPHLLFNSLNFIHSSVYKVSREAAENVILLADMMRFGMEEPDSDGRIILEREIEQLHNLIRIDEVRFSTPSPTDLRVTGDIAGYRIIPLVLMTIAENVFKHGDLVKETATISLQVSETGELHFYTRNQTSVKAPYPRIKSTGLSNIRIRLDFSYPGNYTLETSEHDHIFESTLIIQL